MNIFQLFLLDRGDGELNALSMLILLDTPFKITDLNLMPMLRTTYNICSQLEGKYERI